MKIEYFFIICFFSSIALGEYGPKDNYEAAKELDLDVSWLDPGESVRIVSYDAKSNSYEVVKIVDPTLLKIYTSPENLAAAVHFINSEALERQPGFIVGKEYDLENELVLLEESDLAKRKIELEKRKRGAH
jgi:hypothetical protein